MSQCLTPFSKLDREAQKSYAFPCGKCLDCKKRRARGWGFRLMKEEERSSSSFFITYSYDGENIQCSPNGYMTLSKTEYYSASIYLWACEVATRKVITIQRKIKLIQISNHMQEYMKRLRKKHKKGIKYYVAAEYGTNRKRPHYHAIIFNVELKKIIGKKWAMLAKKYPEIYLNGKFHFTDSAWKHGHITIGKVQSESIAYSLKYISKCKEFPEFEGDDRVPEYQLNSKGLGSNYLTEEIKKWHKSDLTGRYYVPMKGGEKCSLPRYYKEKIYTKGERLTIGNHMVAIEEITEEKRILAVEAKYKRMIKKEHDDTSTM